MPKDFLKGLSIGTAVISLCGAILIFSSVYFGTSRAKSWLAAQGGADTAYYHIIVEGYIHSFLVAGSILFGLGLFISVVSFSILKFFPAD